MNAAFRMWTLPHDEILIDGVSAGKTYAEIAAELGRTANSCLSRAARIGITSPKRPNMVRWWQK